MNIFSSVFMPRFVLSVGKDNFLDANTAAHSLAFFRLSRKFNRLFRKFA